LPGAAGLTTHLPHPLFVLDKLGAGDANRLHVTHLGRQSSPAVLNQ
jgi:hypothetical protein